MVVDFLSQLYVPNDHVAIDNSFLDENLFILLTQNPWYADIANYLTTRKMLAYFSTKERNLLSKKRFNYLWIARVMLYTGPNQVMHQCIREDETYDILRACHDEPYGGHFVSK